MQNLITYYPNYALLDNILSYGNYNTINLFIDLKGIAKLMYVKDIQECIVESTKISQSTDESLFFSLLEFLIFHKKYSLIRGIRINFYIFYEVGESYYHLKIYKKYKSNRKIDNLPFLDKIGKDIFTSTIQKNLELIFRIFNRIPNIKVFMLKNLEADFVPYYLIRNSLVPSGSNVCHLIYSNDHDLFQNIILGNNIYQFLKTKTKYTLKKGEVLRKYLKCDVNIPDEYFPLVTAILGDKIDGITDKVKGIGEKTIPKCIDELVNIIGGMDVLYDKVFNNEQIFKDGIENQTDNKYVYSVIEAERERSVISNNLKLVSFEILSRYLDDPYDTSILEKRKDIEKILNDNTIYNSDVLYSALNKIGVLTEMENPLEILYLDKKNMNDYEF